MEQQVGVRGAGAARTGACLLPALQQRQGEQGGHTVSPQQLACGGRISGHSHGVWPHSGELSGTMGPSTHPSSICKHPAGGWGQRRAPEAPSCLPPQSSRIPCPSASPEGHSPTGTNSRRGTVAPAHPRELGQLWGPGPRLSCLIVARQPRWHLGNGPLQAKGPGI